MVMSVADIARRSLGHELPGLLRNRLNTIFLKSSDKKPLKWQSKVLFEHGNGANKKMKGVRQGYEASVYNAIVLFYYLNDPAYVRSVIAQFSGLDGALFSHDSREKALSELRSQLECQNKSRYLEYIVLGVIPERISAVIESLSNREFNILKQLLPCPFEDGTLEPIALHLGLSIDWRDYKERIDRVEECWQGGALPEALSLVESLIDQSVIRIPLAEKMRNDIRSKLHEHYELKTFLQDI